MRKLPFILLFVMLRTTAVPAVEKLSGLQNTTAPAELPICR